jgi:HEPN domain-containing protein
MLNMITLQQLAETRKEEAKVLLSNKKYDGAYYLSGYVVELALKACIAKGSKEYDFPDKQRALDSYTHNLNTLLKLSGLKQQYLTEINTNKKLELNWAIVKEWSETSRYQKWNKNRAKSMFDAVSDTNEGVFEWIKRHW